MTIDEILSQIEAYRLAHKIQYQFDFAGGIREVGSRLKVYMPGVGTINYRPCCPLESILGQPYHEATTLLGLSVEDFESFIMAADTPNMGKPELRRKILAACGLAEQLPLIEDADPRPAAEDQAPDAEGFLYCRTCWSYTTRLEAELRVFNTGRCAHCNSELTAVKRIGDKP